MRRLVLSQIMEKLLMLNKNTFNTQEDRYANLLEKIESIESTSILTNLSLNSKYKTYISIYSQLHWFNQLRICEQIIVEKKQLLDSMFSGRNETEKKEEEFLPPQIRDAISDLEIAVEAKKRILEENPQIEKMDFDQIQSVYGKEAYMAEVSHKISCQMIASQNNLPYEILEFILRFPDEDKKLLLESINSRFVALGMNKMDLVLPSVNKTGQLEKGLN